MPKNKSDNLAELLRLALTDFDAQIAELRLMRAQLTVLLNGRSAGPAVGATAPGKRRELSAGAREKISAAAKARWAKVRKAKAKAQKPKPAAKKAQSKTKPAKGRPAATGAKKPSSKKGKSKPVIPAADTD